MNMTKTTSPLISPRAIDFGIGVRSINDLTTAGIVDGDDTRNLEKVASKFSVAITPAMLDLINPSAPDDPIFKQFVPDARELTIAAEDIADPIGDETHSPLPGIIHRYPDRLLLAPIKVCPVYCRFCFRRETVGQAEKGVLSAAELAAALDYIREHDEIWEVILSGGDPLLLSPRRLRYIINELSNIEHVRVIRIHTRVPVVSPERVTAELVSALTVSTAVYVVLHSNHSRELTVAARAACSLLVYNGIPMLSQSVLLKGINDDAATLEELFRTLVENRIKPYYLHHADKAPGTGHFRTSIETGQTLMRELRGRVSGLCQPEYMLDIPGGAGKVPVGPEWIEATGNGTYAVSAPTGEVHQYTDNGSVTAE
jgi:lysine 2,3-aminomutase